MLRLHLAETEDFSQEVLNDLKSTYIFSSGNIRQEDLKKFLEKVDIFWFRLAYKIDHNSLNQNTRCRYLVTPVTGIDHIDKNLCDQLGIKIVCLKGETSFLKEVRATAEHTIGITFALMRNLVASSIHVKEGRWQRDLFRGKELYKKKVGIIGFGRLGEICAELFSVFGCEIMTYDIKPYQSDYNKAMSLKELIRWADIISLHVSYDESTHHLIDGEALACFDENKFLINTSRGGIIDEEALVKRLSEGKIAGAALDVLYGEPEITTNPLWKYASQNNNLLITPHIGGNTFESFEKTEKFIAKKLERSIQSEKGS